MDNSTKAWIQTHSNIKFHLLDPRPEEICIEDIAHALSMQCRYTGHTKFHYSVAQHAYYCSLIVAPEFKFEALMHDASEAYICDMSRPLKHYTLCGEEYLKVEKKIEQAISKKFGLPETMSPVVKWADNAMLYAEKRQLMPPIEWDTRWGSEDEATIKISEWPPALAKSIFYDEFEHLSRVHSI